MRSILVAVIGLVTACGSLPTCKEAVTQSATTLKTPAADIPLVISMCEKQGWSAELRTCIASAASEQAAERCADSLGATNAAAERDRAEARAIAAAAAAKAANAKNDQDRVQELDALKAKAAALQHSKDLLERDAGTSPDASSP